MNTVSAQEIKRRGIGAVDELLKEGPVHVIKNNQPQYVVLTEERYRELITAADEAYIKRIKTALNEVQTGQVKRFKSAKALLKQIEQESE
jgi:PHD/YefM family antitoxin component YafN of YafNO toxin-antitoxin module